LLAEQLASKSPLIRPQQSAVIFFARGEVESFVCDGVLRQVAAMGRAEPANSLADRESIERHVERVIVTPQALEVCFKPASEASPQIDDPTLDNPATCNPLTTITLAWTAPTFAAVKGIIHEPSEKLTIKPESRDALLIAIGQARGWIDDIRLGRFASFAEIAIVRQDLKRRDIVRRDIHEG
jgi:hypothetical protein